METVCRKLIIHVLVVPLQVRLPWYYIHKYWTPGVVLTLDAWSNDFSLPFLMFLRLECIDYIDCGGNVVTCTLPRWLVVQYTWHNSEYVKVRVLYFGVGVGVRGGWPPPKGWYIIDMPNIIMWVSANLNWCYNLFLPPIMVPTKCVHPEADLVFCMGGLLNKTCAKFWRHAHSHVVGPRPLSIKGCTFYVVCHVLGQLVD